MSALVYLSKIVITGVARQLHALHAQRCKLLFPIVAALRAEGLANACGSRDMSIQNVKNPFFSEMI